MKRLQVRFLIKGSNHIFAVVMSEAEAKDNINKWKTASHKILEGYDKEFDLQWTVRCDDVAVVYTMDYDKLLEQKRQLEYQQAAQAKSYARPNEAAPLYPPYQGPQGWGPN